MSKQISPRRQNLVAFLTLVAIAVIGLLTLMGTAHADSNVQTAWVKAGKVTTNDVVFYHRTQMGQTPRWVVEEIDGLQMDHIKASVSASGRTAWVGLTTHRPDSFTKLVITHATLFGCRAGYQCTGDDGGTKAITMQRSTAKPGMLVGYFSAASHYKVAAVVLEIQVYHLVPVAPACGTNC